MTGMIKLAAAGVAVLAGSAFADDLTPPSWRFAPGTTVQHWDFSSGPSGFAPDALPLNNSFGSPFMTPTNAFWQPSFAGRNDVWDISAGQLEFEVPNTGFAPHMKEVWLQVTYFGLAPTGGPAVNINGPTGVFTQVGGASVTSLGQGWFHELTHWQVPVCPQFERVTITPAFAGVVMALDQVVIDTYCKVPAPGSAALLALGGLCAVRRRR